MGCGGLDRVDVRLDVLGDADLVQGDPLLDHPVRRGGRDEVDRGRVLVGRVVGEGADDVPVDAAIHVERIAAAGADHERDELLRVGLVLLELGAVLEVADGPPALDVVALHAGVGRGREVRVVGRRDRCRVGAQHHVHQLARPVQLGLDPAGDAGLHVTLAAGHLGVPPGLVCLQLGCHRVAPTAEVGGLGPVDQGHPGEDADEAHRGQHQQQREQAAAGGRKAQPPATQVERVALPPGRLADGRARGLNGSRGNGLGNRSAAVQGSGLDVNRSAAVQGSGLGGRAGVSRQGSRALGRLRVGRRGVGHRALSS